MANVADHASLLSLSIWREKNLDRQGLAVVELDKMTRNFFGEGCHRDV